MCWGAVEVLVGEGGAMHGFPFSPSYDPHGAPRSFRVGGRRTVNCVGTSRPTMLYLLADDVVIFGVVTWEFWDWGEVCPIHAADHDQVMC